MKKNSNAIIFYFTFFLILVLMYSKSWLPGGVSLVGFKETYYSLFFCIIILFFEFDLLQFLRLRIIFSMFERLMIYLMLLVVLIATIKYNPNEFFSIKSIANIICYALLIIIYFFLLPKFLVENPEYFEKLIKIISNFGFIFGLFGFILFFGGFDVSIYNWSLISIINHPNNSSIVFTIAIFPTLFYIYWKWNVFSNAKRIYYIFSFIIQLGAQLFTFTRAGMIATFIGLIIFFGFHYRAKFLLAVPFFVVMIPLFGVAFFKAKGFASFLSRFYLLLPAYDMITVSRDKMLWGYGITNALIEYKTNLTAFNPDEYAINDPHNTYVTLILMFGLVFTITLLIFVGNLLLKCIKRVFISKDYFVSLFFIFLVSNGISILIQGLFDAELIKIDYFVIHYLLLLFGLIYLSLKKENEGEKNPLLLNFKNHNF